MKKRRGFLITLSLLSALLLQGTGAMAEEILITNNGIHLGWVISKDRFMTCRKMIMEIGDGSVEGIIDRCPSFDKTPSVKGLIDGIDAPNQVLSIRDEGGQVQTLFYFETAGGYAQAQLRDLEKGDKVTVTVPVPGRAGSIRSEKR